MKSGPLKGQLALLPAELPLTPAPSPSYFVYRCFPYMCAPHAGNSNSTLSEQTLIPEPMTGPCGFVERPNQLFFLSKNTSWEGSQLQKHPSGGGPRMMTLCSMALVSAKLDLSGLCDPVPAKDYWWFPGHKAVLKSQPTPGLQVLGRHSEVSRAQRPQR